MRPVLSREQIRAFDSRAVQAGVPSLVLMENAGRGAAHLIGLMLSPRREGAAPRTGSSVIGSCIRCADERALDGAEVVILVGSGNNGGDGCVVARHLVSRGARVVALSLERPESFQGDALLALQAMEAVGVRLVRLKGAEEVRPWLSGKPLVVDALLGTGLARPLSGELRVLVDLVNDSGLSVVSLDVPTGLDADSGEVHGVCVRAVHTVTFAHLKRGLLTSFGHEFSGRLTVSHLGVPSHLPPEEQPAAFLLEESDLRAMLSPRAGTLHKGKAGRVALLCGSPGTVGAARLAARGALRAGAGLVTLVSDPETISLLESEVEEVMTRVATATEDEEAFYASSGAVVAGPGLGTGSAEEDALRRLLASEKPCVLDATALRWLGRIGEKEWRGMRRGLVVLTPHPGEAAALLGTTIEEVERDRYGCAATLAERFEATVVLKGSRTLISQHGTTPLVCAFGSPALATGGTGDVLSGILGALLVGCTSAAEVRERAAVAVCLHALASELWTSENGDRGLLAHEIADGVPQVVRRLLEPGLTS